MKRVLNFFKSVNLSVKQAVLLLAASLALFAALSFISLTISANTALTNRELDRLAERDKELTRETNEIWSDIGSVTAIDKMEQRAKAAGFITPPKVEYLLVSTNTLTATSAAPAPAR